MKKLVLLFMVCLMMTACEKEVIGEDYPEMEGFYVESCGLPSVTIDSVKMFSTKVNNYTTEYPESKEPLNKVLFLKRSSESTSTTSELPLKTWYMMLYPTVIFRFYARKMKNSERRH